MGYRYYTHNSISSLKFLILSIFITFHSKQMSQSNPRKWTNQFIQECATLYPATTRYALKHRYSFSHTSSSMSHLRHSRSSQMYSSFSTSLNKYNDSDVTRVTQDMEKSLSRLSCVKCRHTEQCSSGLKKKGKENWRQADKEKKYVVANVHSFPVQPVTNTIHTVQTVFVPTPPTAIYQASQIVYTRPAQQIFIQESPIQLQRAVSAPKLSINYLSPST